MWPSAECVSLPSVFRTHRSSQLGNLTHALASGWPFVLGLIRRLDSLKSLLTGLTTHGKGLCELAPHATGFLADLRA